MDCPRDKTELLVEKHAGIEVDHCPSCNGRWLDHHELDLLEATVPSTPEERRATVEYSRRQSELACPVCGATMRAFNYRAYGIELDTCEQGHGFWLDAGEDGKVRDVIEERVRGLQRSASAEASWSDFLGNLRKGGGGGSIWDDIGGLFRRRR
jgi:Zn-finger nucleic acid-binding protein